MELEVRPFSLRDSVETALAVVAGPAAAKNVDLAFDSRHNDFPDKLLGDVTRFRQILLKYSMSLAITNIQSLGKRCQIHRKRAYTGQVAS
jgi:hypothetical protein